MNNPYIQGKLNAIAQGIMEGMLTPADAVMEETYICWSIQTAFGLDYRQAAFESLSDIEKNEFKGHVKGSKLGNKKILAVFHFWEKDSENTEAAPTPKVTAMN